MIYSISFYIECAYEYCFQASQAVVFHQLWVVVIQAWFDGVFIMSASIPSCFCFLFLFLSTFSYSQLLFVLALFLLFYVFLPNIQCVKEKNSPLKIKSIL